MSMYEENFEPELANFSSFVEESFDPSGLNVGRKPLSKFNSLGVGKDGILTIKVTQYKNGAPLLAGATATPMANYARNKWQLFGACRSIAEMADSRTFPLVQPFDANISGKIAIYTGAPADLENVAFWQSDGSLFIGDVFVAGGTGAVSPKDGVLISCVEKPYRFVLKQLNTTLVIVRKTRFAYRNEASLDYGIEFTTESFLGKEDNNTITPRTYFDPNQQQSKTVDLNQEMVISQELALTGDIDLNEPEITFTLFVRAFNKSALMGKI